MKIRVREKLNKRKEGKLKNKGDKLSKSKVNKTDKQ